MPAGYVWRAVAAPYVVLAVLLVGLGLTTAMIRGDKVMRLGIVGTVGAVLAWALTFVAAAGLAEPAAQARLLALGLGPVALVGPGALLLLLGGAGVLERHRVLVIVASVGALLSMLVTWTTPWVMASVRTLPSGLPYPIGGPLMIVHTGQLAGWVVVGIWISRHGVGRGRARIRPIHVIASLVVVGASVHDGLLAHGTIDTYPLVPACALIAAAMLWWYVARHDILRARGFDDGVAIELGVMLVGALGATAVVWARGEHSHHLLLAFAVALVLVGAAGLALWWRSARASRAQARGAAAPAGAVTLEVASLAELQQQAAMAAAAAAPVEAVRLWLVTDDGVATDVFSGAREPVDGEVQAYLARSGQPLVAGDLATVRLGARRAPLEHLLATCGPDVLVPLREGDKLIGVLGARRQGGRALRGRERARLAEVGAGLGQAATYLRRQHQAEVAADAAREVELAEVARAQIAHRSGGELGRYRLNVASRAAAGVALEAWGWEPLDERRLAFFVADVAGTGVTSALLASSLVGAFTAAARGPEASNSSVSLAKELHRVLRAIAPSARAAAVVAILDAESGRLEWTNAGHRGGTLARRGAAAGSPAYRVAGDSAPLGGQAPNLATGALRLEPDQLLVVLSDGAMSARDRRGRPWGEARLGAAIAKLGPPGLDDEPATALLAEIMAYVDGEPLHDDVLVLTVAPLAG